MLVCWKIFKDESLQVNLMPVVHKNKAKIWNYWAHEPNASCWVKGLSWSLVPQIIPILNPNSRPVVLKMCFHHSTRMIWQVLTFTFFNWQVPSSAVPGSFSASENAWVSFRRWLKSSAVFARWRRRWKPWNRKTVSWSFAPRRGLTDFH